MSKIKQRRGLRAYPIWAIILLTLGWIIIAASLALAVDFLMPALTGAVYGHWLIFAATAAVTTVGISVGLALIAIAGAGRHDGTPKRWKLWAKLLLVLGGALC